ncbi:hypothetical protein SDC9_120961 [bioreactor metagenome]|uniref:Uncharacterized protein n=1 Tax=bioreactor metagenome TaxID=1076179 RepID=A0A645CAL8_9ZZZZ
MQSGDCGVVVGYDAMVERRTGLKTALDLCRAELDREKNPLTCDGCRWLRIKYGTDEQLLNTYCWSCSRGVIIQDRYEPKGE